MSGNDGVKGGVPVAGGHRIDAVSWRLLELLAVLIVSISLFGLAAMRLGHFHAPQMWIAAFLATFAYARWSRPVAWIGGQDAPYWHLLLVLGVALLFRLPPFTYLLGGQDEGVYTNMAAHLVRTGSLEPVDMVLRGIHDPMTLGLYRQDNAGLPGIYLSGDRLEFQFYHLFPVWLALFGSVFGVHNAAWALTFLSLVSLLYFQRLAQVITGSSKAGLAAGLLLAVNPLHAFFSKFPVTEVPTLAFSTIAFCFLLVWWSAPSAGGARRWFWISLGALALVFMTRISGFMYVPWLVALLFSALLVKPVPARRGLIAWTCLALGLFGAGVLYGLKWSHIYSTTIYQLSFQPSLGDGWKKVLASMALLVAAAWLGAWRISRRKGASGQWLKAAAEKSVSLLPLAILALTAVAAWKAYRLGYTDAYSQSSWYVQNFGLSGKGMYSVRSTSLVVAAIYLCPLLLLGFYFSCFRKLSDPVVALLLLFVTCFFGYVAVMQWVLPYQPYYARYLLSEFVPYTLLFVVCAWHAAEDGLARKFLAFVLVVSGIYGAWLSAKQIGKNEHDGTRPSLERLVSHFDPRDLVFVDAAIDAPNTWELETALIYTYGIPAATADDEDMDGGGYTRRVGRSYHDVFYITRSRIPPEGFVEVDTVDFVERQYCHGIDPPTSICVRADTRLFVYRKTTPDPTRQGSDALRMGSMDPDVNTLVGSKADGLLVATGQPGFVMFGPYVPMPKGSYTLVLEGSGAQPFTLDIADQRGVRVFATRTVSGAENPGQGELARLDFELPDGVEDLEVRVSVAAGSDIRIEGYRIVNRVP
ncbi:MAG: hypothetical protein QM601_06960 [Pseudoxanthomonas sp.]